MGIPVIFTDGKVGNIHGDMLDHLIRKNEVVAFRRAKGWVQIGRDLIRRDTATANKIGQQARRLPANLPKR